MITISDEARAVLNGPSIVRYVSVESWLDGELLADDIPVTAPSEESDSTLRVPEILTLTVPRVDPRTGIEWTPTHDRHPLYAGGQRLRVELGIGLSAGRIEWIQRGWFVIQSSVPDDSTGISVSARGLWSLVDEARLVSPFQPSGTLVSTVRALVEPALTVTVDTLQTPDRSVPSDVNYDEDRLGAVLELLDAWPARAHIDPQGFLVIDPPAVGDTPSFSLTDGKGGTLVRLNGSTTRDGAYNVVVARGTAPDGAALQGVAYDLTGPARYGGPFNPLPVPFFYYSPLLTTQGQCDAAADTIMRRKRSESARSFQATIVPDPTLELNDVGTVYTAQFPAGMLVTVEGMRLPYMAGGGLQTLTLREVV